MGTSVLVSISVLLSLELKHYGMHSYTYYRNSIVGRLEDKDPTGYPGVPGGGGAGGDGRAAGPTEH